MPSTLLWYVLLVLTMFERNQSRASQAAQILVSYSKPVHFCIGLKKKIKFWVLGRYVFQFPLYNMNMPQTLGCYLGEKQAAVPSIPPPCETFLPCLGAVC